RLVHMAHPDLPVADRSGIHTFRDGAPHGIDGLIRDDNIDPDLWQQRGRRPGGTSRAAVPVLLTEANDLGGGQAAGPACGYRGHQVVGDFGLDNRGDQLHGSPPLLEHAYDQAQPRGRGGPGPKVSRRRFNSPEGTGAPRPVKADHAALDQAGPGDLHWRMSITGRWAPWTRLVGRAACG